jgi:zinc protease
MTTYRFLAAAAVLALAAPVAPVASVAAAPARPAAARAQPASDLPADPAVRTGILANGMRYQLMRNATPPGTASIRLRFDVGSL